MKDFLNGLKFWRRPLFLLALCVTSVFVMVTAPTAMLWGPAIPMVIASGVLAGFDIYGHLAERHFQMKKLDPNSGGNYKKELRRLQRLRRSKVREAFAYKGYGSGKIYVREALELEKQIEAHKNGDEYPAKEPARVGRSRY